MFSNAKDSHNWHVLKVADSAPDPDSSRFLRATLKAGRSRGGLGTRLDFWIFGVSTIQISMLNFGISNYLCFLPTPNKTSLYKSTSLAKTSVAKTSNSHNRDRRSQYYIMIVDIHNHVLERQSLKTHNHDITYQPLLN